VKAYKAKSYSANRESVKKKSVEWYAANRERARETHAKWAAANFEKKKADNAKWCASHPENQRASYHKRRARIKKTGGFFTVADIRCLLKQQKRKCVVCRTDITNVYHIDHIMPLALGGRNEISNIQLLCPFCNISKKDKHPIDFMQSRGFLL